MSTNPKGDLAAASDGSPGGAHTCIADVDAMLAKHNGKLATGFLIHGDLSVGMRLLVQTEKIDPTKRKKVPHVTAAFCPFCGRKAER